MARSTSSNLKVIPRSLSYTKPIQIGGGPGTKH